MAAGLPRAWISTAPQKQLPLYSRSDITRLLPFEVTGATTRERRSREGELMERSAHLTRHRTRRVASRGHESSDHRRFCPALHLLRARAGQPAGEGPTRAAAAAPTAL